MIFLCLNIKSLELFRKILKSYVLMILLKENK